MKTKQKFTLVELLVVIAIISILAGMLLPALENAIGSARKISCLSNMKQQYTLMFTYTEENNDFFPGNAISNSPHNVSIGWTDGVSSPQTTRLSYNPYVDAENWKSDISVFFCPSAMLSGEWKDDETFAYDQGRTTYFQLHNYPRGGTVHLESTNPGVYNQIRHFTGGRLSRLKADYGIAQDWIIEPTSDTVRPEAYVDNHDGGGNVLQTQGAAGWEAEELFLTGGIDGKANATALDDATTYTFINKACDGNVTN
ncbi:MAG: type II secretion system protein [Planctomycetota bacterium]|jgi:prepilin-type N-terminal cleavage/methylation domain-containing protein